MLHNCLQYPQRPPLNQASLLTQLSRRLLFRNDTPETLSTPQSRLTVVAFLHRAPTPNLLWVPCGEAAQPCSVCRTIVFLAGDLCGLSSQGQPGSLQQPPPHRGDVSLHSLCGCCHHPCTVNVDSGLFTVHHLRREDVWLAPWAALVRSFVLKLLLSFLLHFQFFLISKGTIPLTSF